MIRINCTDNPQSQNVECSVIVDGREYARLCAIAEKFNEWTRRGLFGWPDGADTAATVLESFLFLGNIEDDNPREAVSSALDGLDMGEALPDFEAECRRRRPYFDEMEDAVKAADKRFLAV